MIDDLENYCLQLYRSQGMLYLKSRRSKYESMLVLRVVSPSIRSPVAT